VGVIIIDFGNLPMMERLMIKDCVIQDAVRLSGMMVWFCCLMVSDDDVL
jgi:hypothetical protein